MTTYELWQDIQGYEGFYMISNLGNIRSLARTTNTRIIGDFMRKEKILKYGVTDGYKKVSLTRDGKTRNFLIHRLIAIHFIPNPNNYPCINHKNSDRQDNRIENLEWCTYSHNNSHAHQFGFQVHNKPGLGKLGADSWNAKPVIQFDLDWNLVKEWSCAAEASRETGIDYKLISLNCNGKCKSAKGFRWKLKKDLTTYESWQLKKYNSIIPEPEITEYE